MLGCVSFDEIMDTIEEAFCVYGKKEFEMPDRIHIDYKNKTLLYMPCFLNNIFGTKMLTVFPENREKNKPVIDGLMLLNDFETGEPVAIIDGKCLTALRTGAVGGVGIRHTTPNEVKTVGLIGAGVQGFYQLLYACKARNIEKITIFDVFKDKLMSFVEKLHEELPNIEIKIAETVDDLLKESEVVITTTTANNPVLPEEIELLKGKHFIGIGSYKPSMREYPKVLFSLLNKVYIDTDFAKEETGDLIFPLNNQLLFEDQIETFDHFLRYEKNKEEIVKNTTFFKSVGMALFDIAVAHLIYKKAKSNNIGQEIIL
ncbi:MAG: ornithine cyclodeaminase family protein [Marinisporobacter sp.]|nr:ornithine cyclodeaminase family protein [Marinisporobacter sp.]